MTCKDTGTGLAIGFFVGAAMGLAIGFLYAPKPGVETRKIIKEKAEEMGLKATGVIDKVQESVAKTKYKQNWTEQHGRQ